MTTIEFRSPTQDDVEDLIELAFHHKGVYLGDEESLDGEGFSLPELQRKHALVFVSPFAVGAIGAVDFTDINSDLSATLHFILRPAYLRTFLKEKTYLDALLDRFRLLNVRKFSLMIPDFNQSAQKLALRMGFQYVATFKNEVYYGGKPRDIHFYEITRHDLAKAIREQFLLENLAEETPDECQDVIVPNVTKIPRKRKRRVQQ